MDVVVKGQKKFGQQAKSDLFVYDGTALGFLVRWMYIVICGVQTSKELRFDVVLVRLSCVQSQG